MGKLIVFAVVLLLFLMGSVFLIVFVVMGKKHKHKVENCTCKTKAKVIEMRKLTSRDHYSTPTTSWFPVYEYYVGIQRIEKQSSFGQDKQIFYDGQVVDLFYNPLNCNEYYVPEEKTEKMKWIMGIVGSALFAGAVIVLVGSMLIF